jgi:hypothetical protein
MGVIDIETLPDSSVSTRRRLCCQAVIFRHQDLLCTSNTPKMQFGDYLDMSLPTVTLRPPDPKLIAHLKARVKRKLEPEPLCIKPKSDGRPNKIPRTEQTDIASPEYCLTGYQIRPYTDPDGISRYLVGHRRSCLYPVFSAISPRVASYVYVQPQASNAEAMIACYHQYCLAKLGLAPADPIVCYTTITPEFLKKTADYSSQPHKFKWDQYCGHNKPMLVTAQTVPPVDIQLLSLKDLRKEGVLQTMCKFVLVNQFVFRGAPLSLHDFIIYRDKVFQNPCTQFKASSLPTAALLQEEHVNLLLQAEFTSNQTYYQDFKNELIPWIQ